MHGRSMLGARCSRQRGEIREAVQRQIHLQGRALYAIVADRLQEFRFQILRICQLQKSPLGVQIRRDYGCMEFVAVLHHNTTGSAVAHQKFLYGCVGPNFGPGGASG